MSVASLAVMPIAVAFGGESDDGEWFSRPDHPLLNDLVLDILLKNVKAKELKECRLVCTKWNFFTIPFMRSAFKVTIHGNQDPPFEENGDPCKRGTRRIEQFVRVFSSNLLGIPFDTFTLGAFGTNDRVGKEFLNICGETAKGIDFIDPESGRKEVFMIEDLSELLKSSPKLRYLRLPGHMSSKSGDVGKLFTEDSKPILAYLMSLTNLDHYPEERRKCCPTFFEELLEVAPNTSLICTHDHSSGIVWPDHSVEDILTAIEKLGREASLEALSFSCVTEEDAITLERLAEKPNGLKLRELKLNGGIHFYEFISATFFKDSLEFLDLDQTIFTHFFVFPTMPRLKSLRIAITEDFDSKSVDLNKIFPTLETLALFYLNNYGRTCDEFLSEAEPCLFLKSFEFSFIHVSLNDFNQTLKVFPKLTKLALLIKEPDGIEILVKIWTHMMQLESLDILFLEPMKAIESLDSVFTGIPFQTLQEIEHILYSQNLGEMTPQLRRDTIVDMKNQHCQLPSIGNLINLKCLDIFVVPEGDGDGTDLTDLTAYLGFYLMPRLKHSIFDGTKFTEAALDILKRDMGFESRSSIKNI